jgi:hypothetical protein
MRKKLIGVIAVTIVAVAFCIGCLLAITHVVDRMEAMSMEAQDAADRGDTKAAIEWMARMATEWEKHRSFLETLISHDEMHTVAERYTEAEINLKRDHMDDFYKSMALLQEILEHIREQERVRLGNIL